MGMDLVYSWCIALVVPLGFVLFKCWYNFYLHPLSRFPGPKLAAVGSLYEFWFDVVKDGRYLWEIAKMHDEYGMNAARQISENENSC